MATPQLSPGIITREVDLTVGRADNVLANVGAIAGPFSIGPVDEAITITTEQDLINTFGKPLSTDNQYEYWMSASSFLSYGGILQVARADGSFLNNANAGVGYAATTVSKIKNFDDYNANWSSDSVAFNYAAKNPGTWANSLKVCVIDDLADQSIGIGTTNPLNLGIQVGYAVTTDINSSTVAGVGTVTSFSGHLKGIITGVTTDATNGESSFLVKITDRVSTAGTETDINYVEYDEMNSFQADDVLYFVNNSGINTGTTGTATSVTDWYNAQTLGLTNSTVYWSQLAPKPITNQYCSDRNSKNDAIHVVVVDDSGSVSGVRGNILEKNISLSKAGDAISAVNSPLKIYYKDFLANNSKNIYSGANVSSAEDAYWNTIPRATGFSTACTPETTSEGLWGQDAQGITFSGIGNITYTLTSGKDYTTEGSGMTATLGALATSYDLFSNKDEIDVDFLINGPGLTSSAESQAKANKLIAIAEERKDCIAVVSPHRTNVVNVTNTTTQTNNVIEFFSPLSSSSYAVFDSGYKYTYDRFNNKFRYIPCNGDIAGLMVRTDIEQFPWYSPAGQQRGILNNAIKLSYNPNKTQRDTLYESRINSIINQPGTGVMLYGDKTGLSFASAFDRINVRRLFLTIEQALENVAQAQLFEFNDAITRSNFVNVVEPYLRDVQAKRGIHDFRVICDGTNNTPDVIDNNEFRADIFIKPNKAINYVTLTFVATRTGISFEEVTGTV
mgnify:FL=1|tara:strand:+ start:11299 stop:13491 length:2193 start_codon:yes stop_codon:yes gene_type:complete